MNDACGLTGRTLAGGFEIGQGLGEGAASWVFRARHLGSGKEVAVKVLRPTAAKDEAVVRCFRREAEVGRKLHHPNAMKILGIARDPAEGWLFMVMEHVPGVTLQHALDDASALSVRRSTNILSQVLSLMNTMHSHGVLHRDIKPANILLTSRETADGVVEERVKVCDFGLVKLLKPGALGIAEVEGPSSGQGAVVGTPAFMSPEQAIGRPMDARSDLYACGAVLYYCLSGRKPFSGDHASSVRLMQVYQQAVELCRLVPTVEKPLSDVVMKALTKDPAGRFQTAKAFQQALQPFEWAPGTQISSSWQGRVSAQATDTSDLELPQNRYLPSFSRPVTSPN
jgi:serine/threonine protein kinase